MITLPKPISQSKSLAKQFIDNSNPKPDDIQEEKVESMQDFYNHKPSCQTETIQELKSENHKSKVINTVDLFGSDIQWYDN